MITVGTMQLHQPQAPDAMEPFFVGGEYHTDIARLASHDHSGGLLGAPVAVTIPDGSITAADLDPSVLAPYALTDGSKPFSGTVTMQADAVVRDRLSFGEQGTALAPDAWWERAGVNALRTDSTLGVGVAPAGWQVDWRAVQVGSRGSLAGHASYQATTLTHNAFLASDGHWTYLTNAQAQQIVLTDGGIKLATAPATTGWVTGFDAPKAVLAPAGTLTLTPDSGQAALSVTGGVVNAAGALSLSAATAVELHGGGGVVQPATDNGNSLGASGRRWTAVYAVAGAINTSLAEAKQDITPLAPEDALAAVRATDPVLFDYKPPERGPEWYELPDDPEQAEAILLQRLTAAPLEAGARHQAGFVLSSSDFHTDPLFETGEGQSNAANSVGILIAAVQAIDARLTALEGA